MPRNRNEELDHESTLVNVPMDISDNVEIDLTIPAANAAPEAKESNAIQEDDLDLVGTNAAIDTEVEREESDEFEKENSAKQDEAEGESEGAATPKEEVVKPERGKRVYDQNRVNHRRQEERRKVRDKAEEDRQVMLARFMALNDAMHNHRILMGEIASVRMPSKPDDMNTYIRIKLEDTFDSNNVLIADMPYDELYQESPIDVESIDLSTVKGRHVYLSRQRQMIEKLYGLKIPVIVSRVRFETMTDYTVLVSRKEALQAIRAREFLGRVPLIEEGHDYDAQIMSVAPNSMALTLGGVDMVLKKRFITNRFIQDMRSYYRVGDMLRVRVVSITLDREHGTVDLHVDPMVIETEEALPRAQQLKEGDMVLGVITRILRSKTTGNIQIYAWIKTYNCPAKITGMNANDFGKPPVQGDEVRLTVAGMTSYNYLRTYCRGNNGNGGMFSRP